MFSAAVPNAIIRRRIMFASSFLPREYPLYWDMVLKFATANSPEAKARLTEEEVKRKLSLIIEDLKSIYPAAFTNDTELTKQLIHMERPDGGEVGVVLISDKGVCSQCHSALALRCDRPSHVTVYSETLGTVTGMHYHKICKSRTCKTVQYYGYVTDGSKSGLKYDSNWADLPYFVSSQETVFESSFLRKMDADILIGQVSYRQKADIYNYFHGYYNLKKQHSKIDAEKKKSQNAEKPHDEVSGDNCPPASGRYIKALYICYGIVIPLHYGNEPSLLSWLP